VAAERERQEVRLSGQTMAEYAIVLAVITIALVTTFAVTLPGVVGSKVSAVTGLL